MDLKLKVGMAEAEFVKNLLHAVYLVYWYYTGSYRGLRSRMTTNNCAKPTRRYSAAESVGANKPHNVISYRETLAFVLRQAISKPIALI